MNDLVSIIIVNYNGARFLTRLIESIKKQNWKKLEVILVDNSSIDNSINIVKKKYPFVKIVESDNLGYGHGCNEGVKIAQGKYFTFLNEDMYLPSDFVSKMVRYYKDNCYKLGAVGCKMVDFDKDPKSITPNGSTIDFLGFPTKGKMAKNFLVSGSPFFIQGDIFRDIKGFNESIFLYGEDIDISWRLNIFGYKNLINTNTYIHHYGGGVSGGFSSKKTANAVLSSFVPIVSNYSNFTILIIIPIYVIYILLSTAIIFILKNMDTSYPKEIVNRTLYVLSNYKKIVIFRKFIQNKRTISDIKILSYIKWVPSFIRNVSYKKLNSDYTITNNL